MPRRDRTTARRRLLRCDRCDHWYQTVAETRTVAVLAARTNGWIVDRATLCPSCAIAAARLADGRTRTAA